MTALTVEREITTDTTLCGGEDHEESTVDKADIITLGDSGTHSANDTCLDIRILWGW
jgi:hypothetical protein